MGVLPALGVQDRGGRALRGLHAGPLTSDALQRWILPQARAPTPAPWTRSGLVLDVGLTHAQSQARARSESERGGRGTRGGLVRGQRSLGGPHAPPSSEATRASPPLLQAQPCLGSISRLSARLWQGREEGRKVEGWDRTHQDPGVHDASSRVSRTGPTPGRKRSVRPRSLSSRRAESKGTSKSTHVGRGRSFGS